VPTPGINIGGEIHVDLKKIIFSPPYLNMNFLREKKFAQQRVSDQD